MNEEREVLAADRHQLLRGHLMSEISRDAAGGEQKAVAAARPKRRLGWLALPALAGGLALALMLTEGGPDGGAPGGVGGVGGGGGVVQAVQAGHGGAPQVLDHIAEVAAAKPIGDVKPGQFVRIKSVVSFTSVRIDGNRTSAVIDKPHQRQIWLSVDGSKPGLLVEEGQKAVQTKPGDKWGPNPDGSQPLEPNTHPGVNGPTYSFLAGLPTDPGVLLKKIYEDTKGTGQTPDQEAFATIGDLLREQIAPPAVTAGLYRAAAQIPGVELIDDAVDASGRHGIAVGHVDNGARTEWIFDRTSYEFLGERTIVVKDGNELGKPGTVTGQSAVLDRAIVDKAGE